MLRTGWVVVQRAIWLSLSGVDGFTRKVCAFDQMRRRRGWFLGDGRRCSSQQILLLLRHLVIAQPVRNADRIELFQSLHDKPAISPAAVRGG
ncbi:hypothetical protein [Kribbella sp. NBC_00359]|uniref:hypothetical protein n=1 Tax=Kribbella sp. NBC_00359 TaxID=2975966 RepID=UPI002E21A81F